MLELDINSHLNLLNFMNQAVETGKPIATNTKLWFKNDHKVATLIFAPFYSGKTIPKTIEDRKRLFMGVALGVYRVHDMMEKMIPPYLPHGIFLT